MPEIGIVLKNGLPQNPNRPAAKDLAQCVRRRLHYSQVPIRCQRESPYQRPARSPFKLPALATIGSRTTSINTAKSCPESPSCIFRVIAAAPRCKKSLSMIDLSPTATDSMIGDLRSKSKSTLGRSEEAGDKPKEVLGNGSVKMWIDGLVSSAPEEGGMRAPEDLCKAASRLVCHVLVLNAWRRRRDEIAQLRETIDRLGQQVEHLHIQIVVLRRLLDTENNRVGRLTGEIHRAKTQLDDVTREYDALRMEKQKLEDEIKRLGEISEERLVMAENLRNELFTAQNQLQSLDAQISRDREKLLKLREDKRILLEKVSASEALAAERTGRAERAEAAVEELQLRLAAQVALAGTTQEQMQRCTKELKLKEDERMRLEKRLKISEETGKTLNLRVVALETRLTDKEAALRRIESAYNSQLTELSSLRERLIRQSQEGGWSTRMLQIAGSVVRAPRAILRTLSFLSSPGAP